MKQTIATVVLVSLSLFGSTLRAQSDADRDAVFEMVSEAIRDADCEGQPCIGLAGIGPIDGTDFAIAPRIPLNTAHSVAMQGSGSAEPPPVPPRDPPSAGLSRPASESILDKMARIFGRIPRIVKIPFGIGSLVSLVEMWVLIRGELEYFLSRFNSEEKGALLEYALSSWCSPDSARRTENGIELILHCQPPE